MSVDCVCKMYINWWYAQGATGHIVMISVFPIIVSEYKFYQSQPCGLCGLAGKNYFSLLILFSQALVVSCNPCNFKERLRAKLQYFLTVI